jgi:hypothetical protein
MIEYHWLTDLRLWMFVAIKGGEVVQIGTEPDLGDAAFRARKSLGLL